MSFRDDFRDAMRDAGISTEDRIIADGQLHRVRVRGDGAGKRNGWYVLYDDEPAAGAFGCWKRGIDETWRAERVQSPRDQEERRRWQERAAKRRREQEEAERRRRLSARERAARDWRRATPADQGHPYLQAKGIQPHGARQIGGKLQVPVRGTDGVLRGLQRIDRDGSKRFLLGTEAKGGYFAIGRLGEVLILAEGFATGATLHEATGLPVAVCFSAGNLAPVATALRERHGESLRIVVAADDDSETPGNPGVTAAREAAEAVGGVVAIPDFEPGSEGGDFNDLARVRGLEAVRAAVRRVVLELRERWSLPELLGEAFPEPVWIVEEVLPAGLALLVGAPKAGKSRMATNIALSVGIGGLAAGGLQARRGGVLYIDLEQNPRASQRRFQEVLAGDTVPGNVTLAYKWPLLGEGFEAALEAELRRDEGIRLVILDTLARVWSISKGKQRGNAYHQEYEALSRIKGLADRFGVCILALHHESKAENPDKLYRASGTMAMTGVPDTIWMLSRKRGESGAELYVTGREVRERTLALTFDPYLGTWSATEAQGHLGVN